jgi:hypothetical protein
MQQKGSAAILTIVVLGTLMWAQGPTQFHPGFNLFSKEQDVQLGRENVAQVRKQMGVIKDPVLTAYVTRIGQRLVSSREAKQADFPSHLKWSPIHRLMHSLSPVAQCSSIRASFGRLTMRPSWPA